MPVAFLTITTNINEEIYIRGGRFLAHHASDSPQISVRNPPCTNILSLIETNRDRSDPNAADQIRAWN